MKAFVTFYDSFRDIAEYKVGTHHVVFGAGIDGYCYNHQSFDCELTPEEQEAVNVAPLSERGTNLEKYADAVLQRLSDSWEDGCAYYDEHGDDDEALSDLEMVYLQKFALYEAFTLIGYDPFRERGDCL